MEDNKELLTEEELTKKFSELEEKEKALDEKEKKLNALDKKVTETKYNLYSHITATKDTMDRVVGVLTIVLAIAIIAGIVTRG